MPARKTLPRRIRKAPVDKVAVIPEGRSTSPAVKGDAGTTGMRQSARKRAAAKRLSADDALSEGDFQKVLKAFVPDIENIAPVPGEPDEENATPKIRRKSKDSQPDEDIEPEEPEEENTLPKIRRKLKDSQPDEGIEVCDDEHDFCTRPFQISNRRAAAAKKRDQKVVAERLVDAEVTETNSEEKQSEDEEEEMIRFEDWQTYIKPIETPRSSEKAKYKPEEPEEENTLPKIQRKLKDSQPDEDIEVCDDEHNFCTGPSQISNNGAAAAKKRDQKVVAEKLVDAEVTETNSEEKQSEDEDTIQSVEPNCISPLEGKDTEGATLPKTLCTIPHNQASSTPARGITIDGTIQTEGDAETPAPDFIRAGVQDGMDNGIFAVESLLDCGGDGAGLKKARNQKNKWELITEEMYQRKQIYNLKTSEIKQKMELRKKKIEFFDLEIEKAKLKIENMKKRLELEMEVLEQKKKKYAAELG